MAEGIETADELHAVIDVGVQFSQGHLLAPPEFSIRAVRWPART